MKDPFNQCAAQSPSRNIRCRPYGGRPPARSSARSGELAELFQWLPADQAADLAAEMPLRRNVESEVADVFIYLVSLARTLGIDLAAVAANKIESQRRKYPPETVRGLPGEAIRAAAVPVQADTA